MPSLQFEDLERIFEALTPQQPEDDARARKARRILEAATALFTRHGYRKTSVDDVARRARVAKGTVYLYYPSKADLLIAALMRERRRNLEAMRPVFDPALDGRQKLETWLRLLVTSLEDQPLTARLLSGDRDIELLLDEMDPELVEQMMEIKIDALASMLEEAAPGSMDPAQRRKRARVLIATFQSAGFFSEDRLRLGLSRQELAAALAEVIVNGVAPRRPAKVVG